MSSSPTTNTTATSEKAEPAENTPLQTTTAVVPSASEKNAEMTNQLVHVFYQYA